jgi:hypothetical protein
MSKELTICDPDFITQGKRASDGSSAAGCICISEEKILDKNGRELNIGDRVGCTDSGEFPSWIRGATLLAFVEGSERPYSTSAGWFKFVQKDHQPDMDDFISKHVH